MTVDKWREKMEGFFDHLETKLNPAQRPCWEGQVIPDAGALLVASRMQAAAMSGINQQSGFGVGNYPFGRILP